MASQILDRFCEKVAQIIRTEAVVCYALGVAENQLFPESVVSLRVRIKLDSLENVDLEGESAFAQAAQRTLETRQPMGLVEKTEISSGLEVSPLMLVPIIWEREPLESDEEPVKRPVGMLAMWNKRGGTAFDDDDITLVRSLSNQAAALLVEEQLEELDDIQTAFSTVPVGLMLVDDRKGEVLVANVKAKKILQSDSVASRKIVDLDNGGQLAKLLEPVHENGEGQANGSFVDKSGETFTCSAQHTQDGQTIIAFTQSPFTTAAEELTGQVAHELRTPLTVIEGNLQTIDFMLGPDMTDDDMEIFKEFVGTALIQSARMFRLISETLNISRIHAGKEIELDVHEFNLREALDTVMRELGDYLTRHEIIVEAPEQVMIHGDQGKIISIFDNYLKNAAKYANPGTRIWIRIVDRGEEVAIEVQDEGIGIPPDALAKIGREAGFRTDVSKKQAGGIGLGMIYVRRVTEAHGGHMEIESELGVGSLFRAVLPKKQATK